MLESCIGLIQDMVQEGRDSSIQVYVRFAIQDNQNPGEGKVLSWKSVQRKSVIPPHYCSPNLNHLSPPLLFVLFFKKNTFGDPIHGSSTSCRAITGSDGVWGGARSDTSPCPLGLCHTPCIASSHPLHPIWSDMEAGEGRRTNLCPSVLVCSFNTAPTPLTSP